MDATSATPSYLPWDTSAGNRFANYSSHDHSAPLWIAALLGLIYVVGMLMIRVFIKWHVFGWDDCLIVASTTIAVSQFILIYSALHRGLGESVLQLPNATLVSKITRWSVITSLDIGTEVLTLCLPPYMVWQLQMRVQDKLRVIVAFSFRLIVIVLSAFHLHAWIDYTLGLPSSILVVQSLIWQQALLVVSLVSATIPNLKAFLQSLSANWGERDWSYATRIHGSGTFELENINASKPKQVVTGSRVTLSPQINPSFEIRASTVAEECRRGSLGSGESQDLIIWKETAWTIERT
ncbi:hypothetical protein P153DRAFT_393382 [Dothidotthia symphoricarpi CBS 119687]|uniref:Rhodopsin domain-containing protein n=1 Tax=Dothidotthia symphoricarpi CBS 119687 TaxID=1392245 RepID=A0A6A6ANJ6_9PLEO|nr:uncharacterized protein P153DRAFT_393382 [Dothidotthia symphoricarpi CBS 119687]KAF2133572.1 hypothetical protein P153DRAFT_393382 [Dothidotthia symphoricarpi CBS 119687]